MSTSLRDCVAEFVDKPPGQIGVVMIHLQRAREREPLIEALQKAIGTPLEVRKAADGAALIAGGHPTECGIDPGIQRTAGEVGCVVSHVEAARDALAKGLSHLVVFEDDCAPATRFSLPGLREYLQRAKRFASQFQMSGMDELFLLSTCGCYKWHHLTRGVKVTNHFNGSHAYGMGRATMEKVVAFYDSLLAKGQTAPIDGILPILLREEGRWAFCPEEDTSHFHQNRAIPSYVVGDGSTLRRD